MGDCCNCGSEAKRDGSGQLSRYLKALDPSYALIDDRSIDDLLVFTKRYANQIRFYDIPGSNPNNAHDTTKISWREFFKRDMAVIAASISLTDIAQIKKDYDELHAKIDAYPSPNNFDDLFDPIIGMIAKIDGWYSIAIPENPLHADLLLAINSNLKWQAKQIVAYEKGFNYIDASHPLGLDYTAIKNRDFWGLNETIKADITIYKGTSTEEKIRNAALYIDDIFNSFYGFLNQLITNCERYMQFALEQYPAHQPHMALFLAFLQMFRLAQDQMNGITARMLDFYYRDILHLTAKPSIPDKVHIVFELAKDVSTHDMPAGTPLKAGKDASNKEQFYFTENDLVVNQAKVKEIKNMLIETVAVDEMQPAGSTQTSQIIQNIYARPIAKSQDGFGQALTDVSAKWPTFGKGNAKSTSSNLCDTIALQDGASRTDIAEIGFAIASPQLLMQGGNRLLQIRVTSKSKSSLFANAKDFETKNNGISFFNIYLSGDKGWIKVENILTADEWSKLFVPDKTLVGEAAEKSGIFDSSLNITKASYYLEEDKKNKEVNALIISVYLPPTEQSFINFDAKLHAGYQMQTTLPVARILINPSVSVSENNYRNFKIRSIEIRTKVGSINSSKDLQTEKREPALNKATTDLFTYHSDGLKKLVLQNKDGILPPDKPFDPFTAYPFAGRSFYIGSDEVFNKPFNNGDDGLAINILKTKDPASVTMNGKTSFETHDAEDYTVSILKERQWNIIQDAKGVEIFTRKELTRNILNNSVLPTQREPIVNVTEWRSNTEKNFIKIDLHAEKKSSELGKKELNEVAGNTSFLQESQNLAPELEIKEISISYDSTTSFKMGVDQFFHIYPFGAIETFLDFSEINDVTKAQLSFSGLDKQENKLWVNAGNALLPQFNFSNPYSKYYHNDGPGGDQTLQGSKSANAIRLLQSAKSDAANTSNQYNEGELQRGMLLIGLENLLPLQSISMLFQFAEGSAEDEDGNPPIINWTYLANNEWKPLKAGNIVFDGTYGFQTTGIIKIDIPADATSNNTIVTTGLTWLCASVKENANCIPQLVDIETQAVEAKFRDNNNDQSHFENALPAGSISKMKTPVAEIKTVKQPFASFDGKHQEIGKEFYTRVSERLRHKGRAITAWDYEHLVLDRFPSIYKVKCFTHTDPNCLCRDRKTTRSAEKKFTLTANPALDFDDASKKIIEEIKSELNNNKLLTAIITPGAKDGNEPVANDLAAKLETALKEAGIGNSITKAPADKNELPFTLNVTIGEYVTVEENCCGPQMAPGHVLIIPVSNLKNRNAVNPLQPKTSQRTLMAIQEYLQKRTSPFVHVHAKNPVYEQIIVSFKVQFYSGIDKGYYIKKLNDEIVYFLTPWAFDENADVKFNQKIYASSIINFIEERPYVDFITDFVMGVCCNECCSHTTENSNGNKIQGKVYDDEAKQHQLEGITMKIKELNYTTTTAKDGAYSFSGIPPGNYTLIAYFSLFNIAKQQFAVPNNTDPIASLDFIRGGEHAGYSQDEISAFFGKLCSCNDIEQLLENDRDFAGDIVAEPCTSRSLLVSVPQHIIVPYDEDNKKTPCEKRKMLSATPHDVLYRAAKPAPPSPPLMTPPVEKTNQEMPAKQAANNMKKVKPGNDKPGNKPKRTK